MRGRIERNGRAERADTDQSSLARGATERLGKQSQRRSAIIVVCCAVQGVALGERFRQRQQALDGREQLRAGLRARIDDGGADRAQLQLRLQLQDQAGALADAEARLESQSGQLEELYERLDFAERLLAQAKQRPSLGSGSGSA